MRGAGAAGPGDARRKTGGIAGPNRIPVRYIDVRDIDARDTDVRDIDVRDIDVRVPCRG
ncbi:hypothetical protein ACIBEA_42040 [Streptomyces sp. NPDC051555]|uniref:hypothetical protein n=1 Tax=Streptomyces sp. NPDC051555 TaxID=3365657 RepID=UPI0037B07A63